MTSESTNRTAFGLAGQGLSRRHLLRAGVGAGTLGIAASTLGLAGCTTLGGAPIGRVVVVGGGYGGATAARYLRLWGGNVDVTLIERNDVFVSCPISNLVLGGYKQIADVTRGYEGLKAAGVKVVKAEVTAIDTAGKKVRTSAGEFAYDRLVLSPGIDFMTEQVGGLQAALDSGRVLHAWKAGAQTVALRRQLEAMPDGGVFAMCIPLAPYRCPPGPYERACMVASYLKAAKPRSKVLVLDANPDITSKAGLFRKAWAEHYAGIIEYKANSVLRAVEGTTAKLEFEDVKADVLNVIPGQRAGDIARAAGIINANNRWVGVNWQTLESTAARGVHALGDITLSAPAMPKSGHMANQHGKVAASAIISLLKGEAVNPTPVIGNTCYSFVTARDVVHVTSVHRYDAKDATFKAVPGSGGLSSAASQTEGRYALAWGENIWADSLAA